MLSQVRSIAVNGMLGYGYPTDSLRRGLEHSPHMLGVDAGSTDAGPYYLGHGVPLTAPRQIERDLRPAMRAAHAAKIPLIVGSAGFGGARPHVELFLAIADRIAREESLKFRTAVIYADLDRTMVQSALAQGRALEDTAAVCAVLEQMAGVKRNKSTSISTRNTPTRKRKTQ